MSLHTPPEGLRPGDFVRCTSVAYLDAACPLRLGQFYRVLKVERYEPDPDPMVRLKGLNESFYAYRFMKVADDPVAARMAVIMREHEAQSGACTVDDLARAGFTSAEIIEMQDEARRLAGPPSHVEAA